MANKNNRLGGGDFDNFDFDSMDNMDDFGMEQKPDNRGPIRKLATSFAGGVADAMTDGAHLRRLASAALPEGYGTAINTTYDTYQGVTDLYNVAANELRPALPAMRKAAGAVAGSMESVLPKALVEKLKNFAEHTEYRPGEQVDPRDTEIAQNLAGIFGEVGKAQLQQAAVDTAERRVRNRVEDKQHANLAMRLDAIRASNDRLVAYQDQVAHRYYQKSLELQYRQLFTTRDIYKLQVNNAKRDFEFQDAMLKNTAMSDRTKVDFEDRRRNFVGGYKDRLLNRFQQGVVGRMSNFTQRLKDRAAANIKDTLGQFVSAIQMGETAASAMDGMGDLTGETTGQTVARGAGGMAAEYLGEMISPAIRARLSKNRKLGKTGSKLNYLFQNLPEHLIGWARKPVEDEDAFSLRGIFTQFIKDMIPRGGLDHSFGVSPLQTADQPAQFDQLTRRSIIEIIPGFLSRIHHELAIMRTGDPTIERTTYNLDRGKFTSFGQATKDAQMRLFDPTRVTDARESLDRFIDQHIDKDGKLSPAARDALKRQLAVDTTDERIFDPARYGSFDQLTPELTGANKEEVIALLQGKYQDGQGGKDYEKLNEAVEAWRRNRNLIDDPSAAMSVYRDAGQLELLDAMNLVLHHRGQYSKNFDRIMDNVLTEAPGVNRDGTPPPITPTPGPGGLVSRVLDRVRGGQSGAADPVTEQAVAAAAAAVEMVNNPLMPSSQGEISRALDGSIVDPLENRHRELMDSQNKQLEMLSGIYEVLSTRDFLVATGDSMPHSTRKGFLARMKAMGGETWQGLSKMPSKFWNWAIRLPGRAVDSIGRAVSKTTKMAGTVLAKGAGLYGKYVKGVFGAMGTAIKSPFKAAAWLGGTGREWASDVLVKGRSEPALYWKKIKNGDYVDAKTGLPIRGIKDIKGEVKDIHTGNVVLTQAEYDEGLYDSRGRKIGRRLLGGIMSLGSAMFRGYTGLVSLPFRAIAGLSKLAKVGFDKLFENPDVYLPGESSPRMTAFNMRREIYRLKDGTVVKSFRDIKGAVYDHSKNPPELVLDEDQAGKVCDARGKKLATRAEKIAGAVMGVAGAAASAMGTILTGGLKLVGGMFNFGANAVSGTLKAFGYFLNPNRGLYVTESGKNLKVLEAIHDLLEARLPDNGTGRKGSWQEQMKAAAEKKKARAATLAEKTGKGGFMSGIAAKLGSAGKTLFGDDEEDDDDDSSMLSDAADAADIYDAANGDGDGRRGRRRRKKKRGLMGRMWDKTKGKAGKLKGFRPRGFGPGAIATGVAMGLGGNYVADKLGGENTAAGRAVGTAADVAGYGLTAAGLLSGTGLGATLASGAAAVGTGALAILASPVVLVGLAAAAVGAAAYYGYKYYQNNKDAPFRKLRMAQYGIDVANTSQLEKVMKLEALLNEHVMFENGRAVIKTDKLSEKKLFDIFGLDGGWFGKTVNMEKQREFYDWLQNRFKPVYLNWMSILHQVEAKKSLAEVDDLKPEQKKRVLDGVRGLAAVYGVSSSPFVDEPIVTGPKLVDAAIAEITTQLNKDLKKPDTAAAVTGKTTPAGAGSAAAAMGAIATAQSVAGSPASGTLPAAGTKGKVGAALTGVTLTGGTGLSVRLQGMLKQTGSVLAPLDSIRFRAYGLRDLDADKVAALIALEHAVLPKCTAGKDGLRFEGAPIELFEQFQTTFGVEPSYAGQWLAWFNQRFFTVFSAYVVAVRTLAGGGTLDRALELAKSLDSTKQLAVAAAMRDAKLQAMLGSTPVWQLSNSPWPNYVLNADPRTVFDNIEAIKQGQKTGTVSETKSVQAGGKGAKGKASTREAEAQNRAAEQKTLGSRVKDWLADKWDRLKQGGSAMLDNVVEAGSNFFQGNTIKAAGNMVDAVTAPFRYLTGHDPKPIKIEGTAKDREKMLIAEAMRHGIKDPTELAMFLAQVSHESGGFKQMEENLKYRPEVAQRLWPRRFPSIDYARQVLSQGKAAFAEVIYGKRMGNDQDGDGYKYRGRGPMQLTGKANYKAFAKWSGVDVVSNPDLVASDPRVGALSAVHYWVTRVRGKANPGDLRTVTRLINGGYNGLEDRRQHFTHYLKQIGGMSATELAGRGKDVAVATTTTANGAKGGVGPARPNFSNVVGGSSVSSQSPGAAIAGASAPAASVPRPMVGTGYADVAAGNRGPMLPAAPDIRRSNDLQLAPPPAAMEQDRVLAARQEQLRNAAAANDMRSQQQTQELNAQIASIAGMMSEQVTLQRTMVSHLSKLVELGSASGNQLAQEAQGAKPTAPATETALERAKRLPRRSESLAGKVPVSMRRSG